MVQRTASDKRRYDFMHLLCLVWTALALWAAFAHDDTIQRIQHTETQVALLILAATHILGFGAAVFCLSQWYVLKLKPRREDPFPATQIIAESIRFLVGVVGSAAVGYYILNTLENPSLHITMALLGILCAYPLYSAIIRQKPTLDR